MKLRFIALAMAFATGLTAMTATTQVATAVPDSTATEAPDALNLITTKQMNDKQVTNPLEAINGRVAGLSITPSNGMAAMAAVRVRGTTSLTGGNDPLIIIDGVIGNLSMLSSLYLADIESFDVLKDASQIAQYGSRGASGVIVVTTKKGTTGRATMTYNGRYGLINASKNLHMLDADGYRRAVTERGLMLIDPGYNTNWQRAIEQHGWQHDHHLAFSGGGKDNGYRVSVGYLDHGGVILHEKLRNFTSNINMYQNMFGNLLKIEVGMFGNIMKETTAIYDMQKTFYSSAAFIPTFPSHTNASGSYDGFTYANQINHPLALMDSRTRDKTTHLSTHAQLTFNLGHGVTLKAFGAYSHDEVEREQFLPTSIWAGGQAFRGTDKTESLLANISVNYVATAGLHHFDVLALAEAQRDTYTGFNTTTTNFNNNSMGYHNIQAGALSLWEGTMSYRKRPTMTAFMGRATWDYDKLLSLSVTARADGSSNFGDNHKWGFFPSLSGTWVLSRMAFMKDVTWVDNLKLKAGIGLAGNQGGIDSYMSMRVIEPMGIIPVGNKLAVALNTLRNASPDLKWEVRRSFNVGLEASMFKGRLLASLEFYKSKTTDMLYNYTVPTPPFLYPTLLANLGSMSNNGAELSLGITPLVTRDWELSINANLTFQQTKLLSLSGRYNGYDIAAPQYVAIASLNGAGFHGGYNNIVYQIVGKPLGVFYLPHCTGLVEDVEGGDKHYAIADLDGDGIINLEDGKDRRVCGQAVPKVLLGSNISLRYRSWDLSIQVNGAFGHKIYNGTSLTYMNMESLPGYNVLAKAPAMRIADQIATDYWLERGDYVNIDYVTLGWNVPLPAGKAVKRLRLSFTVNNLATITGYSGLTPIINSSNVNGTLGVDDKRTYPVTRSCALGVSITF